MDGLKLLVWKNFKILSRNKVDLLIDIVAPISFGLVLIAFRMVVDPTKFPHPVTFDSFTIKGNVPQVVRDECDVIYYTPSNPLTDSLIHSIRQEFFQKENLNYTFEGFPSESELIESYLESVKDLYGDLDQVSSPILAAIVFHQMHGSTLPKNIKYTLRFPQYQRTIYEPFRDRANFKPNWNVVNHYSVLTSAAPRARKSNVGGFPGYFEEGFLYLQYAVDWSLTKSLLDEKQLEEYLNIDLQLQRFPHAPFTEDFFIFFVQMMGPFLLVAVYICPTMNLTRSIVQEKSSRLKEFMKIFGLTNLMHWTGWFIRSFVTLSISTLALTILLKIKVNDGVGIFTQTNPFIIFLTFMCYTLSLIGFSFFFSTLFSVAETAATGIGFLNLIAYMPYFSFFGDYQTLSRNVKLGSCLFNINIPISFALYILGAQESSGEGVQWKTFTLGATPIDNISLAEIHFMMLLNALIFTLLAFYVELAFPGQFGVPLPWYFPITKWYWTGQTRGNSQEIRFKSKNLNSKLAVIETEPKGLLAEVQVEGLTKVFGNKIAVNNLSIKMYEGQVTSLLGHNGSGKTTFMSILTGMITPSSGTALVNSFDIRKDMTAVRRSLGLCPQYNVLFDSMTVEEHLKFYCNLKGYNEAETIEEIERMLDVLELQDKRKTESKNLSGGMKRKLSVGIAFCAGSKVILLDEPTAGMDVNARRSTWDLIQAEKIGRTVIFSTHYMEEADILGDRIAIMAEGQLECCGSSFFLKSKYGSDYTLTIVKKKSCNSSEIRRTIEQMIPTAKFNQEIGAEFSLTLPITQVDQFSLLFQELDDRKEELGIRSYGVRSTTLEEIFFRVGIEAEEARKTKRVTKKSFTNLQTMHRGGTILQSQMSIDNLYNVSRCESTDQIFERSYNPIRLSMRNKGLSLLLQQFYAMLIKKFKLTMRNYPLLFLQMVVPASMIIFLMTLVESYPTDLKISKKLYLTLDNPILAQSPIPINCNISSRLCHQLKSMANTSTHHLELLEDTSVFSFLTEKMETCFNELISKYQIGFDQTQDNNIIGYFNNQPFHNPPLVINFVTNSILHSFGLNHQINIINHPFDYTSLDWIRATGDYFSSNYLVGVLTGIGISFLTSSFLLFPIHEKAIKFKHLQLIAGLRVGLMWLANFCIDIIISFLSTIFIVLTIMWYDLPAYQTWSMYFILTFILMLDTICMLLVCAFISTMADRAATSYARLTALQITMGSILIFTMMMMKCPHFKLEDYAKLLNWVYLIFPGYAMGTSLTTLGENELLINSCKFYLEYEMFCQENQNHICCTSRQDNYFAWEGFGIGKNVIYLVAVSLIALTLLIIQESGLLLKLGTNLLKIKTLNSSNGTTNGATMEMMDVDVVKECERINRATITQLSLTDNLVIRNMSKVYKNSLVAVDNLNVGVKKGEIFGLLGANGAGKTTTFKMITGDISITHGDAYINSYSIRRNLRKARSYIGYCPQFDACIEQLTGRETLQIFARLKGVEEQNIDGIINHLGDTLLFNQFLDKLSGTYSGGNKRKLSTAISMIGEPSIIFLDEPSAGMDPRARRHVWDAISQVRDSGTSIIISSHNMEECETLCSQLAIMVKGRFQCLGSPQHLRSKLCQGFNLVAQLRYSGLAKNQEINLENILPFGCECEWHTTFEDFNKFLMDEFPGCVLKDSRAGFVQYLLPYENTNWAKMFSAMEAAKEKFGVEAYSLSQVDLESVFFNFVQNSDGT